MKSHFLLSLDITSSWMMRVDIIMFVVKFSREFQYGENDLYHFIYADKYGSQPKQSQKFTI